MPEQPLTNVIEFDPEDEYRPEPEPEPAPPTWIDGTLRIGIHTSIAGGYNNALESADNVAPHFARKRRWHGHRPRRAPGRNRRNVERAAKPASGRVPRHRASLRRRL